jgi:CRP/FNR family transcriptional regulator
MLDLPTRSATMAAPRMLTAAAKPRRAAAPEALQPSATAAHSPSIACRETLALIERHLPFLRRTVQAGCRVQRAGETFRSLHVVNSGVAKLVNLAPDGRAQVVGLHFKGDWIGFDGIATGRCACDAVAMDTSDVWSVPYTAVVDAAATLPALLRSLHVAMSGQLARERAWRLAHATLASEARVADFVCAWAGSLAARQMRTDTISLRMTRMEIGTYLGMTHETVSRAFTRLERLGLLSFESPGRRRLHIADLDALASFVRQAISPADELAPRWTPLHSV